MSRHPFDESNLLTVKGVSRAVRELSIRKGESVDESTSRHKTIVKDDRTDAQREILTVAAVGIDRCMSGWGGAEGRKSYAAWATTPDNLDKVEAWVRNRSDMTHVRTVDLAAWLDGQPAAGRHVHVYAADTGHPSLDD